MTSVHTSPNMDHQQPQSILSKLPAELRLVIYSLVYTVKNKSKTNKSRTFTVELIKIGDKSPPSSLLRTCKAIYKESHDSFNTIRQHYLSNTLFTIPNIHDPNILPTLNRISPAWFAEITRIQFKIYSSDSEDVMELRVRKHAGIRDGSWELHMDFVRRRPGYMGLCVPDMTALYEETQLDMMLWDAVDGLEGTTSGERRLVSLVKFMKALHEESEFGDRSSGEELDGGGW